jgi:DNA-binding IclR family transcriptional regulator
MECFGLIHSAVRNEADGGRCYDSGVPREVMPVRSVQRALALLSAVAQSRDMSLAQVSEAGGVPPSTAHRLLTTLVDLGFVQQDPQSRVYRAGHRLLVLASAAEQRVAALRAAAGPHMTQLAADCGETAHLTILDGADVIFIDQVLGPGTIRMEVAVGRRMPAHVTAAGKVLLAWQSEAALASFLAGGLQRFTPRTVTDPADLRRELSLVRRRGWGIEVEEHEEGSACVAAHIASPSGPPIASLSVSGPTSRLRAGALPALGNVLRDTADGVARSLAAAQNDVAQERPAAGAGG